MSWKDELRPASFRGVPFKVGRVALGTGRRFSRHEFLGEDGASYQDLGQSPRSFPIEGWVIGDDYLNQKEALERACEASGPGILIHPTKGKLTVVCRNLNIEESLQDGGMAKFSFVFEEDSAKSLPSESEDPKDQVSRRADIVIILVEVDFPEVYSTANQPEFLRDEAESLMVVLADLMEGASFLLRGPAQARAQYFNQIAALRTNTSNLVISGSNLARDVSEVIALALAAGESAEDIFSFYQELLTFGDDLAAILEITGVRIRQSKNQKGLIELVKTQAIAESCRAATSLEFSTFEEAREVKDKLITTLNSLMEETLNDGLYLELQGLRTSIFSAIPGEEKDLPRLAKFTPKKTISSLQLAYSLYGNLDLIDELVDRNKIPHPGFFPSSVEIEVLTNG